MVKRVIGLTGGIGAGKSTAATILAGFGAVIVDCDQLGRLVAEPDGRAFDDIVARFGADIVGPDGSLDRPKLGSIVFNDADALTALNAISHPAIDAEIEAAIDAAPDGAVVVLDMAVLVESDLGQGQYDEVLVIEAPREVRLDRLAETRNMSAEDAEARMNSQASDADRRRVADHVIINDDSPAVLGDRLHQWWRGRAEADS